MTEGKVEIETATTPSDSRDRPPSRRFPSKQASPSWYIENPRQEIHTYMANIKAVVFSLLYPEEQEKSAATVPNVLEVEIGGRILALPATPENIQSERSGAGCHGGIK